jgi:hypothetical protein
LGSTGEISCFSTLPLLLFFMKRSYLLHARMVLSAFSWPYGPGEPGRFLTSLPR